MGLGSELGCCMVQRREGRCIVQHLSYAIALTLQKYALPFTCPSLFRKSFDRFTEINRYTPSSTEITFTRARALHRSSAFPPSPFTHHGVPHRSPWVLVSSRQGASPQSRGLSSQPWWTHVSPCRTHVSSKAPPFQCLHPPSETIYPISVVLHLVTMVCEG